MDLGFGIQKSNKNQHPRDNMCVNFHVNRKTLTFLARICLKMNLGL